jgi:hypothetical protein
MKRRAPEPVELQLEDTKTDDLNDSTDSLIVEEIESYDTKHKSIASHKTGESLFYLTGENLLAMHTQDLLDSVAAAKRVKKNVRFDMNGNAVSRSSRSSVSSSMNSSLNSTGSNTPQLNVLVKPILKSKITANELEKMLKREQKRQDAVEKLKLISGSVMLKYNAKGDKHKRLFYLSEDESELQWKKHKFSRNVSSIDLASVKQMIIGPRTSRFCRFDWVNGKPWLCFSLITDARTVDIECQSIEEFDTWFQGLNALVPTSKDTRFSRGKMLWQRALIKSIQISVRSKINSLELVWQEMVNAAYSQKSSGLERFLVS